MDSKTVLIGRYALIRLIGSGGMGQVWAATDAVLDREVAVKTVDLRIGEDAGTAARFQREARAVAAFSHPNIVTVYDSGAVGSTGFLVMELLPGPSLARFLADRGPLPQGEAVSLAQQVASGLAAAHAAGVIHRDIKPANLMFDAKGTLKILDFGIARLAQATTAGLTATNTVLGSAPYLSPEQVIGGPVDERADLYALGCVLMTMLTGRPPFEGEHPLGVMQQHVSTDPPRLRDRRADAHPGLDELIGQLLSKSPADRPASATAVLARLQAVSVPAAAATGSPGSAATTALGNPPTRVLPSEPTPLPPAGVREREAGPLATRHPGAVLLALAAIVIAVVLVALIRGNGTEADRASDSQAATAAATKAPDASTTPSATPSTTPSATPTTPSANAPPTTGDPAGATATIAEAITALRAAVVAAASRGELQGKSAQQLQIRVDELANRLVQEGGKDSGKRIRDFAKQLEKLTKKGELSEVGMQRIQAALVALQALIPASHD